MRSLHLACLVSVALLAAASAGCSAGTSDSFGTGASGEGGSTDNDGGDSEGGNGFSGTTEDSTTTGTDTGCPLDCQGVPTGPCEEAVCNMETRMCELQPIADDEPCDDGLFCTDGDSCQAGECVGGPPRDCGESNDCDTATCNEEEGECSFTPVPNGTTCVAADPCTSGANSICINGACTGTPKDCSGVVLTSTECQTQGCDPATGECVAMPINDGVQCFGGVGNFCDINKTCDAGQCSGSPGQGVEVTVDATGLPAAITDYTTTNKSVTINQTGTVSAIEVLFNITHTFDGDLTISLDAPAANPIILSNRRGSSGDNFLNTTFATFATTPITTGMPPFSGIYLPEDSFSSIMNTAANGAWNLSVADGAGGDTGQLTAFRLHLCVEP